MGVSVGFFGGDCSVIDAMNTVRLAAVLLSFAPSLAVQVQVQATWARKWHGTGGMDGSVVCSL